MQIRRDYSQPFFSGRRRRRGMWRWLLLYVVLVGGFLFFVDSQFSTLQSMALEVVGQAPPPTPFASELATRGMERYMAGNLLEAASLFRQAVNQQPNNVDYLYEYGRILLDLGAENAAYYTDAIAIGDQAINANPNDPRGYAIKTRALDLSGQPEQAVPVGQLGLNIDPNFAPLHAALSSAYLSIDRYDVALREAERAIEIDPYDPASRRIYSYVLTWLGRSDEAIEQLEQALSLNPNMAGPYFELASQYRAQASRAEDTALAQERYAQAIALYEEVLAMQPQNARAYLRLCDAYFEARENQRAEDYCQEAVNINPQYSAAWASLGQTQYSQRNYESAIESFENCIETAPDDDYDIRCDYIRGLAHYYLADTPDECSTAWNILTDTLNRIQPELRVDTNPIYTNTVEGLRLTRESPYCTGFQGRALPTPIPPTAVPPTPIGG
ncbi:MAG TPA: tetratricopeptide repeat protein [Oceanobacillus sp.]|nr:tetratricopeptide repeat protein [Oceanobacillus sp.]